MTEHFIGRWGICTHVQCIMYRDQSVMFATISVFLVIEMEASLHSKRHCVHLEVSTQDYICMQTCMCSLLVSTGPMALGSV